MRNGKYIYSLIMLLLFVSIQMVAQQADINAPQVGWQKTFGENGEEQILDMIEATNGWVIGVGYIEKQPLSIQNGMLFYLLLACKCQSQ